MSQSSIVVVEDEAIIAEDIRCSLEDEDYLVPDTFSRGEDILSWLPENHSDVNIILMDVMLAGEIDGIETAGRIKAICDVPVVYLTSFTNEHIVQRAKLTSPFGYIVKPFKNRELFATIEMALYKHRVENKLNSYEICQEKLNHIAALTAAVQKLDGSQAPQDALQHFTHIINGLIDEQMYSATKEKLEAQQIQDQGVDWAMLKDLY